MADHSIYTLTGHVNPTDILTLADAQAVFATTGANNFTGSQVINGSPGTNKTQITEYALVDVTNYGFCEVVFGLNNPAAGVPKVNIYSFGGEGTYTSGDVVTAHAFYIYDGVAMVNRVYITDAGVVKLGGADATANPALEIAVNGALTAPEVAAASVPNPSAAHQSLFIDAADHKLKRKDSSGTVTIIA